MPKHEPWLPDALVLPPIDECTEDYIEAGGRFERLRMMEGKAADVANDAIKKAIGYTEPAPDQCPVCRKMMNDFHASEFLGWHGECVNCFVKREESNGK